MGLPQNTAISGNRLHLRSPAGEMLTIACSQGQKLNDAIWLSGQIESPPLCGGLGVCGRCACRFISDAPAPTPEDREYFDATSLSAGWRLACRHYVPENHELNLELPELKPVAKPFLAAHGGEPVVLGIDLGTTSVQWRAIAKDQPERVVREGAVINPQAGAGPDVVSRIALAVDPQGLEALSFLARQCIAAIVAELAEHGCRVIGACVAANSAMTEILLKKDISGLAHAPYHLAFYGNETVSLRLPGNDDPLPVFIPPLAAPFVGGDISAGLLALMEKPRPFLLIDLGTNAEIALLDAQNGLCLASAPLGPAMEGIGPACGQPAGQGVITGFCLSPAGLEPKYFDSSRQIKGISASGYLSLLAILLNNGIMDATGRFIGNPQMPLARKIARDLQATRLMLPDNMYMTLRDVEMLLKVKAALTVAFQRILAEAGLSAGQVAGVWLAGALGTYANVDDLATLGLLPGALALKARVCGNTALAGACILACHPEKCDGLAALCKRARIIQLADDPDFIADYLAAMRWGVYAA